MPWAARRRALASIPSLFAGCFAPRCEPALSAGTGWRRKEPSNPLNAVCYMWWAVLPAHGLAEHRPAHPRAADTDALLLEGMRRVLWLPSDPCGEAALHGLNHWVSYYEEQVRVIIDAFLAAHLDPGPELRRYARGARKGDLL